MVDCGAGEVNFLVTFHSVSSALYAQTLLATQTAPCKVVPVPRSVSSSCGYALEASGIPASALAEAMEAADLEWDAIYCSALKEKTQQYDLIAKREHDTE